MTATKRKPAPPTLEERATQVLERGRALEAEADELLDALAEARRHPNMPPASMKMAWGALFEPFNRFDALWRAIGKET